MTKSNTATENKARLATIAPAAFAEGTGMAKLSTALAAAFKGRSTGTWDIEKNKAVPSPFFALVYAEYMAGGLAALMPQFGNLPEAEAIAAARKVIADSERGEAAKTALATLRQRWKRALDRAGIQTPRPKADNAPKAKTGDKTRAGQGKPEAKPQTNVEKAAAQYMPPAEKTRDAVVGYIRLQMANMIREVEKFNVHGKKIGQAGMPVEILGDLCDWQERAKKWTF